jgi:hypothetical protein
MIPKVDLTESGDFRKPSHITSLDIPTNYGNISLTQYNSIKRFESIFGKRYHDDERFYIFGISGYIIKYESHCSRCGKELVIPWKRLNSGLCPKCESDLDRSFSLFPWKNKLTKTNTNSSNPKDIFNMK